MSQKQPNQPPSGKRPPPPPVPPKKQVLNFVFMSGSANPFNADVADRRFIVVDAVDVSRDRLSITISEPSNG